MLAGFHRHRQPGAEEGVGELDHGISLRGHPDCGDGDVDLAMTSGIDQLFELHALNLELQTEIVGDGPPQVDADPGP